MNAGQADVLCVQGAQLKGLGRCSYLKTCRACLKHIMAAAAALHCSQELASPLKQRNVLHVVKGPRLSCKVPTAQLATS